MKKIYSLIATVLVAASISAQAFTATYEFDGTPPTSVGVVAGSTNLTASNFSAAGYTLTGTGSRFAHSGAPTSSTPDTSKYFEVTLTPSAGNSISVSTISFRSQRSGTGPRSYSVRASTDSYAANLPASISPANAELTVQGTNEFYYVQDISTGQNGNLVSPTTITNITIPVTFRIYFYNSEAEGGTFSVDDVVISGTVNAGNLAVADFKKLTPNFIKNTLVKNDEIVFGSDVKDIKIYTLSGAIVKTGDVKNGSVLNVAELAKGNYIVTGIVNNEPVSQKILKD